MKWSTVQIPARDLFKAIGREPLLGDKKGKTRWLIFFKDGREELECID
nr:MAG TPA: Histone methyltransferase Tudor domain 1 [Caudoviricetes sp.]